MKFVGIETLFGLFSTIVSYCDTKTLIKVKETSLLKQLKKIYKTNVFDRLRSEALEPNYSKLRSIDELLYNHKFIYLLYKNYEREFILGSSLIKRKSPTALVCAIEYQRYDDIYNFILFHPFYKYSCNTRTTSRKEFLSKLGHDTRGNQMTPLMIASKNEMPNIVKCLLHYGADPNIKNNKGFTALHICCANNTDTTCITLLLNAMTLDAINIKRGYWTQNTALDDVYYFNRSSKRNVMIKLIRQYGGKANWYDENGHWLGKHS